MFFRVFQIFFSYFSFFVVGIFKVVFFQIFFRFFKIYSGFSGIFANIFRHFPRCVAGIILHIFSGTFSGGAFGFRV